MTRLIIYPYPGKLGKNKVQDSNYVVFQLQIAKLARVTKVDFYEIVFDSIVFPATLDFLHRAMDKECRWKELVICHCSGSAGISTFLQVAASLKVFEDIIIHGPVTVSVQAFRAISEAMLADEHGLEKLELSEMKLSMEQTAALARGLGYPDDDDDDDSDDFSCSCFGELSLVGVDFESDAAISALASGLEDNLSLFFFRVIGCNLSDAQVAELVTSLVCHPLIIGLALGENHGGPRAVDALACLLEEQQYDDHLEVLNFSKQSRGLSPSHIQVLVGALEGNQDLKSLNLSGNKIDDEGVDHLAKILSTCPQLQNLDLSDNNISVRGLETLAACHPSSLRKLDLSGNIFTMEDGACHHLLKLLEENPQLGRVSSKVGWKASELRPQIQHLLDYNKSGRVLAVAGQGTTPPPVPLSILPIVLARANQIFASPGKAPRQANVIFHLLQGQAPRLWEPRLAPPQDRSEGQTSS
jgi:hypothetical protein